MKSIHQLNWKVMNWNNEHLVCKVPRTTGDMIINETARLLESEELLTN